MSDGRIVALGAESRMLPPAERTIDATGKIVLPGAHRLPRAPRPRVRRLAGGPLAAAHAGLATLLLVRRARRGRPETLPKAVQRLREEISAQSVLDFGFHFILSNQP